MVLRTDNGMCHVKQPNKICTPKDRSAKRIGVSLMIELQFLIIYFSCKCQELPFNHDPAKSNLESNRMT